MQSIKKNYICNSTEKAAKLIDDGKIVIFPTETVYGIGANAYNDEAVSLIFKLKGRPLNNPLIVHCADIKTVEEISYLSGIAKILAESFWPGPLSLVLKRKSNNIARSVSNGLDTICVRIPSNKIALELLSKTKCKAIAAPSANLSNYISPTKIEHVIDVFGDTSILSGEQSVYGIESSIIDCSKTYDTNNCDNLISILRHGFIGTEEIQKVLDSNNLTNLKILSIKEVNNLGHNPQYKIKFDPKVEVLLAPGMMKKHYSPYTQLNINQNNNENFDKRIHINFGPQEFNGIKTFNLSKSANLEEAAFNLYTILRQADEFAIANKINLLTISSIPNHKIGIAINEKLEKAQLSI